MKFSYFLVLTCIGVFQSASAQTMKAINLEPGDKLINQGVSISIDFTSEKKPWCGLRVDWGNGKSQPVRVGHDGEEGAPTSPIKLSNTYNTAGKYNISVKGELLIRGLAGTALPCEIKANSAEVVVIDPETDTKYIEKSWTSYLGVLPPLQLQCMQVGLAASDIKYEARVESDQLLNMNAPGSKRVMERCQTFVKAIHPKPNVACRVKGDIGFQESVCDQLYGQQMDDGNFRTITMEEAIKLHIQSKPWILGQRETLDGKESRLANEMILKEKEKQLALEAERQKAAEVKAKKDAEEALLRMWKDTGFAVSPLPPCPLNEFNNCFGSGKDSKGNEYIGEFKNNVLFAKGIINYKNGDRYVGEFNKTLNGEGIYYFLKEDKSKGIIFVGQYRDGVQRGNGIYFDRNGGVIESGLYENTLIEYRYVDPATFTRIPAGKIPIISSDARLKIESNQAEIAKKQAEDQRAAALAREEAAKKEREKEAAILKQENEKQAAKRQSQLANGEKIELKQTPGNCTRLVGMAKNVYQMIAQTIGVSLREIEFIGGEYGTSPSGGCAVVVDTPKGIKRCSFLMMLEGGDGKPFAQTMIGPGNLPCN